jgi:hypothetical protein
VPAAPVCPWSERAVSFPQAAAALAVLTDPSGDLQGGDEWRQKQHRPSLRWVNKPLAGEFHRAGRSKDPAQTASLWAETHDLLLDGIVGSAPDRCAAHPVAANLRIPLADANSFFPLLTSIAAHLDERKEVVRACTDVALKRDWWLEIFAGAFAGVGPETPVDEALEHAPELPAKCARRVLDGDGDSLVGRMLLAYLAWKGIPPAKLSIPDCAEAYLTPTRAGRPVPVPEGGRVFRRLLTSYLGLASGATDLSPALRGYDPRDASVPVLGLLQTIKALGTARHVEQVNPRLVGAQIPVADGVGKILGYVREQSGCDLASIPADQAATFYRREAPELFRQASLVADITQPGGGGNPSGGTVLRGFAQAIFSSNALRQAWGSAGHMPSDGHAAGTASDVRNILACAGVVEMRRNCHPADGRMLMRLATDVAGARDRAALRLTLAGGRPLIDRWLVHLAPFSEAWQSARFVQQLSYV